ncbi:MAG: 4Fe-4S dicluster domain-containing protein [Thermodesulfobacteria bacterium]|nr:4Fe-4S dicluster domain-containing protein [Thermodesulfobacteriota bacterium]
MIRVDRKLLEEVASDEAFNAQACFNCGTCTALCPMGLEWLPRELFRYVLLGAAEKVSALTEAVFSCLLCRMCEAQCPRGVRITHNIRTLRGYLVKNEYRIR